MAAAHDAAPPGRRRAAAPARADTHAPTLPRPTGPIGPARHAVQGDSVPGFRSRFSCIVVGRAPQGTRPVTLRRAPPRGGGATRSAHETHADQRHAAGRAAPGDRRRPEAARLRDRDRRPRAAQGQHLQGRRHARRAVARSLLRRLRRRPPRLPAVQGNLARTTSAKASTCATRASRTPSRTARNCWCRSKRKSAATRARR